MPGRVRVKIVKRGDSRNYVLRWADPLTGRERQQSAQTTVKRIARQRAADLEVELTQADPAADRLTWPAFVDRYTAEHLESLAPQTARRFRTAERALRRVCNPRLLVDLDAATLSRYAAARRSEGTAEATIAADVRVIRAALGWAVCVGLIGSRPKVARTRAQRAETGRPRGRPIGSAEFERLEGAVPQVRPQDGPQWLELLRGLWWSGLRLAEACRLAWDQPGAFVVDLDGGRHPRFLITAKGQKSGKAETCPMAPEFAAILEAVPQADRTGRVFKLADRYQSTWIGAQIAAIGQRAGVLVDERRELFASAHALRRSFGTRWAIRVKPAVLQRMMRHASIATSMRYYVDIDADDIGDAIAEWSRDGTKPS